LIYILINFGIQVQLRRNRLEPGKKEGEEREGIIAIYS